MTYERILLTTDGSEGAKAAAEHAVDIAEKYDAELHILYVIDIGVDTSLSSVSDLMSQLESSGKLEKIGEKATEEIEEMVENRSVDSKVAIERGIPHKEIKVYADEEEIDMIVMGTQGRTGLDRMLLGSVAEKVVRSADVPVMTVRKD
jgi:nucleotide-binding universal stress UspA family protein